MLRTTQGRSVRVVQLGATDEDDRLWGRWLPRVRTDAGKGTGPGQGPPARAAEHEDGIRWHDGLLGPGGPDDPLRIVLIPDLSRLHLPAARACLMLMGASVAHLERHGRQGAWAPDLCWLAACGGGELRRVSAHLLDRFALRVVAPGDGGAVPRVGDLRRRLRRTDHGPGRWSHVSDWLKAWGPFALPVGLWWRLFRAPRHGVLAEAAARRILAYHPVSASAGLRPTLGHARLTVALARLEGRSKATTDDVVQAASLLGLASPGRADGDKPAEQGGIAPPGGQADSETSRAPAPGLDSGLHPAGPSIVTDDPEGAVIVPPWMERFEVALVPGPAEEPRARRDAPSTLAAPLRWPSRSAPAGSAFGPVIGVRRATNFDDLAIVETIVEAKKWQPYRLAHGLAQPGEICLFGTDLRACRRAPLPEHMLILLIDYTCLAGLLWRQALQPYLLHAYTQRSSVCLVQVGIGDDREEEGLRARRILARGLRVPRVLRALNHDDERPGRATPLAHGLHLALQTLRNTARFEGGSPAPSSTCRTLFVLITDGRGNVPLEWDLRLGAPRGVGREGVASALRVAEEIGQLGGVRTILLDPRPQHYPEFPRQLARALGAIVEAIEQAEEVLP